MKTYREFIESKKPRVEAAGIEPGTVNPSLFGWQADIVNWAIKRGRAAIFADCGLYKTGMQVEWIRQMAADGRGLIVAPLSVASQTITIAEKNLGVEIAYKPAPDESQGIWITNYERLHRFVEVEFRAIALDESSIMKGGA